MGVKCAGCSGLIPTPPPPGHITLGRSSASSLSKLPHEEIDSTNLCLVGMLRRLNEVRQAHSRDGALEVIWTHSRGDVRTKYSNVGVL